MSGKGNRRISPRRTRSLSLTCPELDCKLYEDFWFVFVVSLRPRSLARAVAAAGSLAPSLGARAQNNPLPSRDDRYYWRYPPGASTRRCFSQDQGLYTRGARAREEHCLSAPTASSLSSLSSHKRRAPLNLAHAQMPSKRPPPLPQTLRERRWVGFGDQNRGRRPSKTRLSWAGRRSSIKARFPRSSYGKNQRPPFRGRLEGSKRQTGVGRGRGF